MPVLLYVCVCVGGWHVLCAAKGPSLEKFSTCHLFRHQLNLKSNQTGCCLCLCLCLSSTGLSLYISSGCLLPLLHLLSLSFCLFLSPLLPAPCMCANLSNIVPFPYAFHLSIFCLYFSSARRQLQLLLLPCASLCCASALLFK